MSQKILSFESFGITDIGLVRDHNEDVWAAYPEEGFFLLADGMGGHACGEVASKEALHILYSLFTEWYSSGQTVPSKAKAFFEEAFAKVNGQIYQQAQRDEVLKGMGTTLCALFFLKKEAIIAHVGDSRIYRYRANQLEQLTEDHSLVAELMALGAVASAEADSFPYKHILTRAIGTQPQVEASLATIQIEPEDLFLLCTDGLTNYVTNIQINRIIESYHSLEEMGKALINQAKQNGGGDNITAILVKPL
jgi:PPM family protein phosphatase